MDPRPTLVIRDPDGAVHRLPFEADRIVVGRTADAGLRLDHAMISRKHAEFFRDAEGRHHVRDLESRNHTFVNGEPVAERLLGDGDQINIGPFTLTLRLPPPDPTSSTTTETRLTLGDNHGRISRLQDHVAPHIEVAQLTTLFNFGHELLKTPEEADRAESLCRLMVGEQFRGHWAVIVRMPLAGTEHRPSLLWEAHGQLSTREPYLSRGVLQMVRETGEAVLASNTGHPGFTAEQGMNVDISISPQVNAMAAVACPLMKSATEIEVLYVMLPPALGGPEWLALVNLAAQQFEQAESVWAARKTAEIAAVFDREVARARQIQMKLVPANPHITGLELAIGFTPCHAVGGDYVDVVPMPDGRTLLAVADVCGKGLGAALVAASVHTMVHACVLGGLGLTDLMTNLNRHMCRQLPDDAFVTMLVIVINPATGETEMANAGHPPAMLISPGQAPRQLEGATQLPLGIEPDEPATLRRFVMPPDDLLALYTDGLSELPDPMGRMLGISGLLSALQEACCIARMNSRRAADELHRLLASVKGPRAASDDVTFLLMRRVS